MTDIAVPTNEDILRFCVAMLSARDDEDLVQRLINQELDDLPEFIRETYLKVVLRVVVAQFFSPTAAKLNRLAPGFVDAGLALQGAQNEGIDLDEMGRE